MSLKAWNFPWIHMHTVQSNNSQKKAQSEVEAWRQWMCIPFINSYNTYIWTTVSFVILKAFGSEKKCLLCVTDTRYG